MGKDQSNSVLSADARANETQEATIWKWSVYPQSHDVHFFGQCQRTKSKSTGNYALIKVSPKDRFFFIVSHCTTRLTTLKIVELFRHLRPKQDVIAAFNARLTHFQLQRQQEENCSKAIQKTRVRYQAFAASKGICATVKRSGKCAIK